MTEKQSSSRSPVPRFLSVVEVSAVLGTSQKTVRRFIDAGKLPVHRFGRLMRVSEADLAAFVALSRRGRGP